MKKQFQMRKISFCEIKNFKSHWGGNSALKPSNNKTNKKAEKIMSKMKIMKKGGLKNKN